MENSLAKIEQTTLAPASVDQFLPPPDPWSRTIGQRIVIACGALILAAAVLPYEQTVRASGLVRASGDNTMIRSEQQGRITQVLIRPNQVVKANQILAVLDRKPLEERRQQLLREIQEVDRQRQQIMEQQNQLKLELSSNQRLNQAQINVSRGDVRKADASLTLAQNEMERYQELASAGAVPKLLSQEKTANFLIASSTLSQAQFSVAEQRAKLVAEAARLAQGLNSLQSQMADQIRQALSLRTQLEDVNRSLDHAAIRSPVAATVISTQLNHVGQVVNAGEVIADLAPLHAPLVIKAKIPAKDVAVLKTEQKAYLRIAACPYSSFGLLSGLVKGISADSSTGSQATDPSGPFYELTIHPQSRELRQGRDRCALKIGMDLQADVLTKRTTILGFLTSKLRLGSAA